MPATPRLRPLAPLLVAFTALLGASCGSSSSREEALPAGTWTWVDVPGAVCSDGSPTGIAVNRGTGNRLVLFLDGGGACWDTLTCFTANANGAIAAPGPFGRPQFDARIGRAPGSILDRTLPGTPFATATLVFVPYCTGDVHAGDSTQDYPLAPRPWRHKGRPNLEADLAWLAANLPAAPGDVVVSGASAGGFGALLAFDLVAGKWPAARASLVDDSGPPLVGNDFLPALRAAWFVSWRLDQTLLPVCPDCATDLSALFPTLAARHPDAALGLLSSRQDQVIRSYVTLSGPAFETALLRLVDDRIAPLAHARAFLVPGDTHTMLGKPADFAGGGAGGQPLLEWITQEVERQPGWATVGR